MAAGCLSDKLPRHPLPPPTLPRHPVADSRRRPETVRKRLKTRDDDEAEEDKDPDDDEEEAMGGSFSRIGYGFTQDDAVKSAMAYLATRGYSIEKAAIVKGPGGCACLMLAGYGWYRCTFGEAEANGGTTYACSLVYVAADEERLAKAFNDCSLEIGRRKDA
jgi:hypothetical protein